MGVKLLGMAVAAAWREAARSAPYSHDNLFHSILGLAGVRTAAHRPERDLPQTGQA